MEDTFEYKIRPGTVELTKPYKKANGSVLPAGTNICFDVTTAKRMIDAGLAIPVTSHSNNKAMDVEYGIRTKAKEKRASKKPVKAIQELPKSDKDG